MCIVWLQKSRAEIKDTVSSTEAQDASNSNEDIPTTDTVTDSGHEQ